LGSTLRRGGKSLLRLIDANLNRAAEGLRVLEDIARFLLEDPALTEWLKSVRHELLGSSSSLQSDLLSAREASGDVGASIEAVGEGERADLCAIATANARRVQESLRVLAEFAKLPDSPLASQAAGLEHIRFAMYDLERDLVGRLLRREKASRLAGLYMILDVDFLGDRDGAKVARQVVCGGASVVQLRDKKGPRSGTLDLAREIRSLCAEKGVLFIVNDHLDVALATCADGLHLGQDDLPISEARKLLPVDMLLGCSTHNVTEAAQAQTDGADCVAIGSIYPTASKEHYQLAGPERLRHVKETVSIPVIAIGGIDETKVEQVLEAGADSIAVITAVLHSDDVEEAARRLVRKIAEVKQRLAENPPTDDDD
jgi:thiamine-phosphate pyrophosphorylase